MTVSALLLLVAPLASAFEWPSWSPHAHSSISSRSEVTRRDANSTTIPAAISIAPSQNWDGIDGSWSSFAIQVGNHAQTVRVLPGTAAAVTLTVNALGCPDFYSEYFGGLTQCEESRGQFFLSNESNTWVAYSYYNIGIEDNLGLDIPSAETGYDSVTLGFNGAGGPTIEHSVVQSFALENFWIGIFGLRPDPTNFTNMQDPQPSYMYQLANNSLIPSLSYGYTAGARYRYEGVYGSLTLGGYDENRFDTTQNVTIGMYQDINRDLLVNLQSITTDSGSPSNLLPDGAISIFIDSTVAQLWLPESACAAFEQAFGLVWNEDDSYYFVNGSLHESLLARNANVTFTLGSQASGGSTIDVVMPYGAFDLNLTYPYAHGSTNSTYYFPLLRAANSTQYTLGRAFLQEMYLFADYDTRNFTIAPCLWDQDKVSQMSLINVVNGNITAEFGQGHSGSSTDVGAIAGGVVGGIVGLAIIGGLIFFFIRRRKSAEKRRLAELEEKNSSVADGAASAETGGKPFISAPIGGELSDQGQLHEMNTPHKVHAQEMDSPYKGDPNQLGYSEMQAGSGYFAPGKDPRVQEMEGATPVYEMPGSDVNELDSVTTRVTRNGVNLSDEKPPLPPPPPPK